MSGFEKQPDEKSSYKAEKLDADAVKRIETAGYSIPFYNYCREKGLVKDISDFELFVQQDGFSQFMEDNEREPLLEMLESLEKKYGKDKEKED